MDRETKFAVALNYIFIVALAAFSIFLTPIMTEKLGVEQYGLVNLVLTIVIYLMLTEFSVGNIIVSNVSKFRETGDTDGNAGFLFHMLLVFVGLSLLATALLLGIDMLSPRIFRETFTGEMMREFRLMYRIFIVNAFLLFYQIFFFSVIIGYQKFIFTRIVLLVRNIIRTVSIILILFTGHGGVSIYIMETGLTLLSVLIFAGYAFFRLGVRICPREFNRKLYRKLLKDTFWAYSFLVMDNVYWNVANLIMGAIQGPAKAGVTYIIINFFIMFVQMSNIIPGHFMPQIAKSLVSCGADSDLSRLMTRGGRLLLIIMALVVAEFAVIGRDFVGLWLLPEFSDVYHNTLFGFAAIMFAQSLVLGDTIVQAKGEYGMRALIALLSTLSCAAVSFVFIKYFGLTYAFAGIAISCLLFRIVVSSIYYRKRGLSMGMFFKGVYNRFLPLCCILVAGGIPLYLWRADTLMMLAVKGLSVMVLYGAGLWFVYLNREEKSSVKQTAAGILKRI